MSLASFTSFASDSWQAQITLTFHPAFCNRFFTSASLRTFASNLPHQNSELLAGVVA
jgi:hypothetical protein